MLLPRGQAAVLGPQPVASQDPLAQKPVPAAKVFPSWDSAGALPSPGRDMAGCALVATNEQTPRPSLPWQRPRLPLRRALGSLISEAICSESRIPEPFKQSPGQGKEPSPLPSHMCAHAREHTHTTRTHTHARTGGWGMAPQGARTPRGQTRGALRPLPPGPGGLSPSEPLQPLPSTALAG